MREEPRPINFFIQPLSISSVFSIYECIPKCPDGSIELLPPLLPFSLSSRFLIYFSYILYDIGIGFKLKDWLSSNPKHSINKDKNICHKYGSVFLSHYKYDKMERITDIIMTKSLYVEITVVASVNTIAYNRSYQMYK